MAVVPLFIPQNQREGVKGIDDMKSIGDRLKAKQGNLQEWIKSKGNILHTHFYVGGYLES